MTRRTVLLSPMLGPFVLPSAAAPVVTTLALTNVSVIDSAGLRLDQTVVLQGDRIIAAGNAAVVPLPRSARRLSGRGKFLIPALWDMHVHLSIARSSALPLPIANGELGVRDMGGSLDEIDRWRAAIQERRMAGPRVLRAGPMLNARAFNDYQIAVENGSEARGAVRALQKSGAGFIKVRAAIGRDAYFGVAEECRKLRIAFAGHVPRAIGPEFLRTVHPIRQEWNVLYANPCH